MIPQFKTSDKKEKAVNIFAAFGAGIIFIHLFLLLYSYIPQYSIFGSRYNKPFTINLDQIGLLINACILAPLWEEVVFRVLPIQILKKTNTLDSLGPYVIVACSAIFGVIHGGDENVFIQGVLGLLFSYVYIKNDFSYKSAVLCHMLWNVFVIFILPFSYSK